LSVRIVLHGMLVDIPPKGFVESILEDIDELFSGGPETIRIEDSSTGKVVVGVKIG